MLAASANSACNKKKKHCYDEKRKKFYKKPNKESCLEENRRALNIHRISPHKNRNLSVVLYDILCKMRFFGYKGAFFYFLQHSV